MNESPFLQVIDECCHYHPRIFGDKPPGCLFRGNSQHNWIQKEFFESPSAICIDTHRVCNSHAFLLSLVQRETMN